MTDGEENPYAFIDADNTTNQLRSFVLPKRTSEITISYSYPEDHEDNEFRRWENDESIYLVQKFMAGYGWKSSSVEDFPYNRYAIDIKKAIRGAMCDDVKVRRHCDKSERTISIGRHQRILGGLTEIVKIDAIEPSLIEVFDDRGVKATISFTEESVPDYISSRVRTTVRSMIWKLKNLIGTKESD